MKTVLTIAGSDSSGGAGIQADLKTFLARGVYGMSVITALTAQNTIGVQGIFNVPPNFIAQQIDSVMTDIGTDVWKTGMLANKEVVNVVVDKVDQYKIKYLVVDPVMIAKSGNRLLKEDARDLFIHKLIPRTYVITPNKFEAEKLAGMLIRNILDAKKAAHIIHQLGAKNVVIKGGHINSSSLAIDILFDGKNYSIYSSKRIITIHTHGTGCTFASAIAAELAKKIKLKQAVLIAKNYVLQAIKNGKNLHIGKGFGPLNHSVVLRK
ncbi:MAG: bifunctional hydroxymethylpyrimidine kinase/phosphomethylpyrimidine kinase [Candidatus Roizmanbacteria bacterium]|nr:bifunctional hydroxymethylpyrimidine kinase/phosphomethylpyrimidine kinase [Candidatus Roizmanbacteria bacterium]